ADRARLFETHPLPRQAAVGRFEDSASGRNRVARVLFTRAGPHLLRVGRRNRELAHRDTRIVVEDGPERGPGIGRLPDAARGCRDEERARGARDSGDTRHAPGHVGGAEIAPAETGEECGIEGGWILCENRCGDESKDGGSRPTALEHDGPQTVMVVGAGTVSRPHGEWKGWGGAVGG